MKVRLRIWKQLEELCGFTQVNRLGGVQGPGAGREGPARRGGLHLAVEQCPTAGGVCDP